jgi:hypothetical protein
MNKSGETHNLSGRKSLSALCLIALFASCRSADPVPPVAISEGSPAAPAVAPGTIRLTVPDTGWQLRVERIYELPNEIWVLAKLEHRPGMSAQMITQVEAKLPILVSAKPQKVFVTGKTWAWKNEESYVFVPTFGPIMRQAEAAKPLFPAEKK